MGSRSKQGMKKGRRVSRRVVAAPLQAVVAPVVQDGLDVAQEAFAARLGQACGQVLAESLEDERTLRAVCEAVEESYAALDEVVGGLDFQPPPVCARGCVHCCFNQVSMTPPEALYLGLHVLERFGPERLEEVRRKVAALMPLIKGRTRRELGDIRHLTPCVFLHEGACSVHPARPLACRGWNSVDVRACRESVERRDPMMPIENHALQRGLAGAVQEGLLAASAALGLEAGYLVITRAVHLLLERGAMRCSEDWLSGGAFFAAAARG